MAGRPIRRARRLASSMDPHPAMKAYYHGTSVQFAPGDRLVGPDETGVLSEKGRKKNLDKVFFTSDFGSAQIYASRAARSLGGRGRVYLVQPLDEIEVINDTPGTTVYASRSAVVLGEVNSRR